MRFTGEIIRAPSEDIASASEASSLWQGAVGSEFKIDASYVSPNA